MIKFVEGKKLSHQAVVGELRYGSVLRGVDGHRDCIYVKVHKRQCGQGINLDWPSNHCVLFNLRSGTLRAIPGSTCVDVLDCTAEIWNTEEVLPHLKGGY